VKLDRIPVGVVDQDMFATRPDLDLVPETLPPRVTLVVIESRLSTYSTTRFQPPGPCRRSSDIGRQRCQGH
jgi:hypothetical protein